MIDGTAAGEATGRTMRRSGTMVHRLVTGSEVEVDCDHGVALVKMHVRFGKDWTSERLRADLIEQLAWMFDDLAPVLTPTPEIDRLLDALLPPEEGR